MKKIIMHSLYSVVLMSVFGCCAMEPHEPGRDNEHFADPDLALLLRALELHNMPEPFVRRDYTHVAVFAYAYHPETNVPYVLLHRDQRSHATCSYGGLALFAGVGNCALNALQMFHDKTRDAYRESLAIKDLAWSVNLSDCLVNSDDGMRLFFVKLPHMIEADRLKALRSRVAVGSAVVDYEWVPAFDLRQFHQRLFLYETQGFRKPLFQGLRVVLAKSEVQHALTCICRGFQLEQTVPDYFDEAIRFDASGIEQCKERLRDIRQRYAPALYEVMPYVRDEEQQCLALLRSGGSIHWNFIGGRFEHCSSEYDIFRFIEKHSYRVINHSMLQHANFSLFVFPRLKSVFIMLYLNDLEAHAITHPCLALVNFEQFLDDKYEVSIAGSSGKIMLHSAAIATLHNPFLQLWLQEKCFCFC